MFKDAVWHNNQRACEPARESGSAAHFVKGKKYLNTEGKKKSLLFGDSVITKRVEQVRRRYGMELVISQPASDDLYI